MKFRKIKKPMRLYFDDDSRFLEALPDGTASLRICFEKVGPRRAIQMARWLERYAKWSSLEAKK